MLRTAESGVQTRVGSRLVDTARFARLWPLAVGCAVTLAACGGSPKDEPANDSSAKGSSAEDAAFVKRCVEHFNKQKNSLGLDFVKNAGQKEGYGKVAGGEYEPKVWFGPSRQRPEKCVAVVTMGRDDIILVLRESFHDGAPVGEWASLAGETEGSFAEQLERLEDAQAVGLPDGRVKLR